MSVRILTDSTNDLPAEWLARYNVTVVPVYIHFGLETFQDKEDSLPKAEFYRRLKTTLPTTSAPPPGDAEKALRDLLAETDHVIAIHLARELSSVIETTRIAAQNVAPERVTIWDSGSLSMGVGWQVAIAAEMAAAGADKDAIIAALQQVKPRLKVWAALNTLENLRRSGRVSWVVASMGGLLQIKPIIQAVNNKFEAASRVRTFKNALKEIERLTRELGPLERLAIMHTENLEAAHALHQALADVAPPDTLIVNAAAAIGTHLAQGAVGVAAVRKAE